MGVAIEALVVAASIDIVTVIKTVDHPILLQPKHHLATLVPHTKQLFQPSQTRIVEFAFIAVVSISRPKEELSSS